ncbi:hypothetical protein NUW58_g3339 [Xylaria curta]|uniref:Uncharacterized protein n=1 Tax=Xylaria curta TaxID=42375 RepID=A0ACC1PD15_9PEZI|nr:hypothetical protein NUW58_g3339 [Xylaria curta]
MQKPPHNAEPPPSHSSACCLHGLAAHAPDASEPGHGPAASRPFYDVVATLVVGATSTIWTVAAFGHIYHREDPDTLPTVTWQGVDIRMQRILLIAVEAPLLSQLIFLLWLPKWLSARWRARAGNTPHLCRSIQLRSPFDWEYGLGSPLYWLLATAACTRCWPAIRLSHRTGGRGVTHYHEGDSKHHSSSIFFFGGTPRHPYNDASHSYSDDVLRVVLPTSHHEGTVYQLPSVDRGFDAIWSPKIANEHLEADGEMMVLFQHMRSNRWMPSEPLERLRRTLAQFRQRVVLSRGQAQLLADWIYVDKPRLGGTARSIACSRAPGVHLVGRDLMYALCHAEYLVFMSQRALDEETRSKLVRLRLGSRTGAGVKEHGRTVGYLPGLEGYREAAAYVYSIFDIPVDEEALNFSCPPPSFSTALGKAPTSIDEYVSELWELSKEHCESTFTALYFFTTVWFMELGNVNGFHIFPLRCRTTDGDLVSQEMMWRQIWYSGCFAQLVAVSTILFGAFVAGVFP